MSHGDDQRARAAERLGPAEERARAALRAVSPEPPDAEFRDRLKRDFVSGAIQVTKGRERVVARLPIRRRRPPTVAWAAASLAVAAALVFVVASLNRGPSWWVTAARGEGTIKVDGETVALADRDAMRRLLIPGAEIETAENAELDLCMNGVLAVQLAPGTRMTLPPPPGRWFGRRCELYARGGEIRVTTGPRFSGARLAIMSPTAAVLVTGTTFAVIMEDAGTCVCVFEGNASVGRMRAGALADMSRVGSGRRRYVYKDERPPETREIREEERVKLAQFRESQRAWMQGSSTD
ncbi:MAG TPA: FecR domain-containing protein [Candidatus Limnocylindrales bacterium]|nr:FecR domain-containing protein [Candidatus Limnocylindrales bacterium]